MRMSPGGTGMSLGGTGMSFGGTGMSSCHMEMSPGSMSFLWYGNESW